MVLGLNNLGWGWLGAGSACVVGVAVARNRGRRSSAHNSSRAAPHASGGVLTEVMMAELLLPSRTSVVVGSGVLGLSTIHLVQTSMRHCVVVRAVTCCQCHDMPAPCEPFPRQRCS